MQVLQLHPILNHRHSVASLFDNVQVPVGAVGLPQVSGKEAVR